MNKYILLGFIGGFIFNILQLLELGKKPKEERPDFKDLLYWLPYVVWPFLGSLLVYVLDTPDFEFNKFFALQVGLSTPLIFRQMIQSNPLSGHAVKLQDDDQ